MGMYLSNSVGYGLMIPYTDDTYDGEIPHEWELFMERHGGDKYEVFQELLEDYPHLSYDVTYFVDTSGPSVIFVDSLAKAGGGFGALRVMDKIMYEPDTLEYDRMLLEISMKIGMPLIDAAAGLGLWSTVSYG